MMKKIMLLALGFFCFVSLKAQSNVVSGGGEGTGSGGSVSFTLGQIDYTSVSGSQGSLGAGMQQAFEIFVLGIENKKINLKVSVYPNPTVNFLNLTISDYQFNQLKLMLFDVQGKLVKQEQCSAASTPIDMSELSQGTYLLKVLEGNQELQSYKVVKN